MCLLIYKPAGTSIPHEYLNRAAQQHQDGFGYAVARGDGFDVFRALDFAPAELSRLDAAHDKAVLIHFRMATHGDVTMANVHPFRMPIDVGQHAMVAHNGMLFDYYPDVKDERSDTRVFIDTMLKRLKPGWWNDTVMVQHLEYEIGYNKIAMLWPTGEALLLNEQLGEWRDEVWYSNDSGFEPKPKPVAVTKASAKPEDSMIKHFDKIIGYTCESTQRVWCLDCAREDNALDELSFGRAHHDPTLPAPLTCSTCTRNLKALFWQRVYAPITVTK